MHRGLTASCIFLHDDPKLAYLRTKLTLNIWHQCLVKLTRLCSHSHCLAFGSLSILAVPSRPLGACYWFPTAAKTSLEGVWVQWCQLFNSCRVSLQPLLPLQSSVNADETVYGDVRTVESSLGLWFLPAIACKIGEPTRGQTLRPIPGINGVTARKHGPAQCTQQMKSKVSQSNSPWWIEANTSYSFTVVQVPIYWCAPGPPAHRIHTNNMGQPILGSSPRIGTSTNMRNKYSTLFRKNAETKNKAVRVQGKALPVLKFDFIMTPIAVKTGYCTCSFRIFRPYTSAPRPEWRMGWGPWSLSVLVQNRKRSKHSTYNCSSGACTPRRLRSHLCHQGGGQVTIGDGRTKTVWERTLDYDKNMRKHNIKYKQKQHHNKIKFKVLVWVLGKQLNPEYGNVVQPAHIGWIHINHQPNA